MVSMDFGLDEGMFRSGVDGEQSAAHFGDVVAVRLVRRTQRMGKGSETQWMTADSSLDLSRKRALVCALN